MKNNYFKNTITLIRAYFFAKRAHKGQKYGTDDYFNHHVMKVVKTTIAMFGFNIDVVLAALLHDTMEDCGTTEKDLLNIGLSNTQVSYVKMLTKLKTDEYDKYLIRCGSNLVTYKVKVSDIMVNYRKSTKTNNTRLLKKYSSALCTITDLYTRVHN